MGEVCCHWGCKRPVPYSRRPLRFCEEHDPVGTEPDPRDARIADLEAKLREAEARVSDLQAERQEADDHIIALQAREAAMRRALTSLLKVVTDDSLYSRLSITEWCEMRTAAVKLANDALSLPASDHDARVREDERKKIQHDCELALLDMERSALERAAREIEGFRIPNGVNAIAWGVAGRTYAKAIRALAAETKEET